MIQIELNKTKENIDAKIETLTHSSALGFQIAEETGLDKKGIIAFKNTETNELIDLKARIQGPVKIMPVLPGDEDYMSILRHDCEHVLAQAVQELYPEAKLSVGAELPNGFAYDFYIETPFTPEDLDKIEERMREIFKRALKIEREVWGYDQAYEFFEKKDEVIKMQLLDSMQARGIETITVYTQGELSDLCRGPHGESTDKIPKHFKLNKLSAAQWSMNKELPIQRVGGVLFPSKQELNTYLENLEEAKKRDHRKLAAAMDLYHVEEHSPGMIFWHPRGWSIVKTLKRYLARILDEEGYMEVNTPGLLNAELWKKSGHWSVFKENMFCIEDDGDECALKPMSCPAHIEVFRSHFLGGVKSYASFPLRICEFGEVYRNEATGALQGLKRLRRFTQDDGHIFCTMDQITDEIAAYCRLFKKVYQTLGFTDYTVDISTRPENKIGDDSVWDKAEEALMEGAKKGDFENLNVAEGEGAFYGPKLDFHVSDSLGRQWQCCTVQLDFILAERLGAEYVDSDGSRKPPVIIHRAVFGSIERFLAILLENTYGYLPLWLAPVQAVFIGMNEECERVCKDLMRDIKDKSDNARLHLDDRNEKLGYKIRDWTPQRAGLVVVLGEKERVAGQVTVRNVQTGESQTYATNEWFEQFMCEIRIPR